MDTFTIRVVRVFGNTQFTDTCGLSVEMLKTIANQKNAKMCKKSISICPEVFLRAYRGKGKCKHEKSVDDFEDE